MACSQTPSYSLLLTHFFFSTEQVEKVEFKNLLVEIKMDISLPANISGKTDLTWKK